MIGIWFKEDIERILAEHRYVVVMRCNGARGCRWHFHAKKLSPNALRFGRTTCAATSSYNGLGQKNHI